LVSVQAKAENLEKLKQVHAKLGWKLLMNEHVAIEKTMLLLHYWALKIGEQNTDFLNMAK
jgi:hypothetical protein